jgi:hypothetical protein
VLFRNYVWTSNLRDGEEVLVVRRLREVFGEAAKGRRCSWWASRRASRRP